METGKLATVRGHTNEVRQFGAMLARDHQMVRQQGRDLAKKLGFIPTPPSGDQSAQDRAVAMQRLSSLTGPAFDRAFLQHEVEFHETAIAAMENTLLPAAANAELRAMVAKVAPAFKAHLGMARTLGKQVGSGPRSSSRAGGQCFNARAFEAPTPCASRYDQSCRS